MSLCQATVLTRFICLFCAVPRIRTVRSVRTSVCVASPRSHPSIHRVRARVHDFTVCSVYKYQLSCVVSVRTLYTEQSAYSNASATPSLLTARPLVSAALPIPPTTTTTPRRHPDPSTPQLRQAGRRAGGHIHIFALWFNTPITVNHISYG